MGLFDKKTCDICGGKIGLLGNRKVDDGNMCKDCASLLSPLMTDRRRTTLADIREHLSYREENKKKVNALNITRSFGNSQKLLIDDNAGCFIVTSSSRWQNDNPDVILLSQVTGCIDEVRESRTELKTKDNEGKPISYNPPRYDVDYDFYITLDINSPWFNKLTMKVNGSRVEDRFSAAYKDASKQMAELKETLTAVRDRTFSENEAAAQPKSAVQCPCCGASTLPDHKGCCEFCGGAVK